MDPLQIILIVLALAGVWAVVELALALRRARATMDGVDKAVAETSEAVGEAREALAEAKPVIAKLDATIDDLQPALEQVEPLLKNANIAAGALSADLVEVEAVIRDVSAFTGAAANAGNAFSGVADSASEAVQRLFGRKRAAAPDTDRALEESAASAAPEPADAPEDGADAPAAKYYTYDGAAAPDDSAKGEGHE